MSGAGSPHVRRQSTPHFERGRGGREPGWIVVHTTVGSFDSTVRWFADPASRVSAHYLVGLDGQVAQFADEQDSAWHCGGGPPGHSQLPPGDPNVLTIGIEFEDGGDPHGIERPAAQYRTGARLIAAIASRWGIPLDRDHVIAHREINPAKSCPGNLNIERLIAEAKPPRDAPQLLCLLPARNAEADLPGYLESVSRWADRVVALDDGSTDRTAEILEASPLVTKLLHNPRRPGYSGWNDAQNRQRLIDAAAELRPQWVLFLDADERIDAEDAEALRGFVERDALPGCAYGLQLHRMWGPDAAIPSSTWVYRLFALTSGAKLADRRLHFNPVPVDIPRRMWIRTTIRVRHLDSEDRLEQRRGKYEAVEPDRALDRRPRRLLVRPSVEAVPWQRRDPAQPVLDPGRELSLAPGTESANQLLCLLPARNAEADLPGYLESVSRWADGVVALDDGSTDRTAEILEASPLVSKLLHNPRRPGYSGWNDAQNRQRLLDAAAELRPRWVLFLDADERIDAEDAEALRGFVERGAEPGSAYGMRVFRMIEDEDHYDEDGLWVYRLFSYEPGQRLPAGRLHLVPIPRSIPRTRWHPTTFRIKHLASLDRERRSARFQKYEEADPDRRFQRDYQPLLREAGSVKRWVRRPRDLPALADPFVRGSSGALDLSDLDPGAPLLSAIVISRDDEETIERTVRSVVDQDCPHPFEVIVVVSGSDRTAQIVRERFPEVTLIELDGPALPGRARNAGLAAARGEYVSFPGSHVELPQGSLAARLRAHELGYAMVTGTVLNGTPTPTGWAAYFLDHSTVLPDRPSTALPGPPAHCSYVRDFLLDIGGFPEDMRVGEDTVVNRALFRRGHPAYRARDVHLIHRNPCAGLRQLLSHHYRRGRGMGRILCDDHRHGRRLLRRRLLRRIGMQYVSRRMRMVDSNVARWGRDLLPRYRRVRPWVLAGAVAAWIGIWIEVLRPRTAKLRTLLIDQRKEEEPAETRGRLVSTVG